MKRIWWIITGVSLAIFGGTMTVLNIKNIISLLPKGSKNYTKRSLSQIKGIVVHHSAIDGYSAFDYAKWHIKRGWPGIGYHFVIEKNGTVNQTNELDTISYHVKNNNTPNIGISLSGHMSKHAPTTAQMDALIKLIKQLKKQLGRNLLVKGHRELQSTECPGKFVDMDKIRTLTS